VNGVLVVDKPPGPTSHDIVDRVRRALGERRAGHTGTLDPFASGVLAVCLGKATRLARFLAEGEKHYRAVVRLGFATTTDDRLGEPLSPPREVHVAEDELRAALAPLTGNLRQVPPAYSARRVGGQRLYALARAGVEVEREATPVTVYSWDLLSLEGSRVEVDVRCSPGTYVRALARDLGAALGVGGHLEELRRTRSGEFGLEGAWDGDALTAAAAAGVRPLGSLLSAWPAVVAGADGIAALRHGRDLTSRLVLSGFPQGSAPARLRVLDEGGELLALAVPRGFGPLTAGLSQEPALHPDVVLLS
jgi:tRNA pseudouridine55 synthase